MGSIPTLGTTSLGNSQIVGALSLRGPLTANHFHSRFSREIMLKTLGFFALGVVVAAESSRPARENF